MPRITKREKVFQEKVDRNSVSTLDAAVDLVKECATAKCDETVDLAINLNVDPRHADQMIRGSVALPHGTGKSVRVLVFAQGDKAAEAEAAGADFVGADDLVAKITEGWMDFDRVVACPDMMGKVGRLGRVLGPRGLMPNPKLGTVTFDVERTVKEIKAGQATFRVDKAGIIHAAIGKASFGAEMLVENVKTLVKQLRKMKPEAVKGTYIKRITASSSQGPGIRIDPASIVT